METLLRVDQAATARWLHPFNAIHPETRTSFSQPAGAAECDTSETCRPSSLMALSRQLPYFEDDFAQYVLLKFSPSEEQRSSCTERDEKKLDACIEQRAALGLLIELPKSTSSQPKFTKLRGNSKPSFGEFKSRLVDVLLSELDLSNDINVAHDVNALQTVLSEGIDVGTSTSAKRLDVRLAFQMSRCGVGVSGDECEEDPATASSDVSQRGDEAPTRFHARHSFGFALLHFPTGTALLVGRHDVGNGK